METPSEDPLVNSRYGVAYTRGLQEGKDKRFLQAVVTLKHYVAYSYEHYDGIDRMAFNAEVSKYDFADTYLPAFRASVVQGKAKGVMCSYNSVNGMPMCANEQLNTKLLREALGFDGYITSDSGAIAGIYQQRHYTKSLCEAGRLAILSGTDVNSGSVYKKCLADLVTSGQLPEKAVDDAMRRTLKLRFELGLFDPIDDQPYWHVAPSEVGTAKSKELSLELTRKSIVLLQNHGNILPLSKGKKLAVIGPHAKAKRALLGNYLGQMCHGDYLEVGCVQTPLEAITAANGASTTVYAKGSGINDTSTADFDAAEAAARGADAVVLFLGIDTSIEREAWDRENIDMPNIQMQLLKRVRRAGKPTVVVLFNGGVVGAEELILHTDGVVEAFYPGFFGAQAVSDILFGDAIPSGKLPVTMYPSNYINSVDMKSMSMTKYPGRSYRYYKEVPVFPFGWGLSYTKFTLALDSEKPSDPIVITRDLDQIVTVIVSNDGDLVGDEVVFAFFRPLNVNATGNAALLNEQLFDYRRVSLRPTQYRKLSFRIQQSTLAMVDDSGNQASFPGFYEVIITNGVHERVTFAIHLVGEHETLGVFPTDEGYISPPAQPDAEPFSDIRLDATRAFESAPVRTGEEQEPAVAAAMAVRATQGLFVNSVACGTRIRRHGRRAFSQRAGDQRARRSHVEASVRLRTSQNKSSDEDLEQARSNASTVLPAAGKVSARSFSQRSTALAATQLVTSFLVYAAARASSRARRRCQSETFPIPNALAELRSMAEALTDSYITLTPTAAAADSQHGSHSAPASDLLARKWAAAAKRKASMEVLKVHEPAPEDDSERDSSRTETDRSSEIGNDEAPSSEEEEDDAVSTSSKAESEGENDDEEEQDEEEEEEEQEDAIPTYVCELHDPKPVLVGESVAMVAMSDRADPVQPRGYQPVRSEQRTPTGLVGGPAVPLRDLGGPCAAVVRVLAVQGAGSSDTEPGAPVHGRERDAHAVTRCAHVLHRHDLPAGQARVPPNAWPQAVQRVRFWPPQAVRDRARVPQAVVAASRQLRRDLHAVAQEVRRRRPPHGGCQAHGARRAERRPAAGERVLRQEVQESGLPLPAHVGGHLAGQGDDVHLVAEAQVTAGRPQLPLHDYERGLGAVASVYLQQHAQRSVRALQARPAAERERRQRRRHVHRRGRQLRHPRRRVELLDGAQVLDPKRPISIKCK
ncbi:hypothetical protein ON010_g12716 [Phytophthora cinnamomi]|nr:hypothetical protein ON010_g12716 [Phytophthora cinnamomi]